MSINDLVLQDTFLDGPNPKFKKNFKNIAH